MPSPKPASGPGCSHALHYLGDESGVPHLSGIPSRCLSTAEVRRYAHNLGLTPKALTGLAVKSGVFTEAARPLPAANSSADDSHERSS